MTNSDAFAAPPPRAGIVVGRFAPPRRRHAFAVDFARAYAQTCTVFVASAPTDAVPAALRAAWLRQSLPGVDVETIAAAPPRDQARRIAQQVPRCDALFSAHPGQRALADALGIPLIPIPPVEDEKLRDEGEADWSGLLPPARAHYARRVALVGPESTGKTTLAARLAAHFGTVWVGEYLRTWLDAKGLPVVPADVPAAARGQMAAEAALAPYAHRVLFCDTDLWLSLLYSRHYYGTAPSWLESAARAQQRHLYLLLETDVPWRPDPQRDGPEVRALLREKLRALLDAEGIAYQTITGDWDARFHAAAGAVEALLSQGSRIE